MGIEEDKCCAAQQWQHSDNESRVSMDWRGLYNKLPPSCASIVKGSVTDERSPLASVSAILCRFPVACFGEKGSRHSAKVDRREREVRAGVAAGFHG